MTGFRLALQWHNNAHPQYKRAHIWRGIWKDQKVFFNHSEFIVWKTTQLLSVWTFGLTNQGYSLTPAHAWAWPEDAKESTELEFKVSVIQLICILGKRGDCEAGTQGECVHARERDRETELQWRWCVSLNLLGVSYKISLYCPPLTQKSCEYHSWWGPHISQLTCLRHLTFKVCSTVHNWLSGQGNRTSR